RHSIVLFFTHPPTTDTYTLSVHDALPISERADSREGPAVRHPGNPQRSPPGVRDPRHALLAGRGERPRHRDRPCRHRTGAAPQRDRKSTRLNSSHVSISYAVFCLKKKKKT